MARPKRQPQTEPAEAPAPELPVQEIAPEPLNRMIKSKPKTVLVVAKRAICEPDPTTGSMIHHGPKDGPFEVTEERFNAISGLVEKV